MKKLSRRSFVKSAAAVGIATTVRPSHAVPLANDDVRLGFIGCGGRAGEHLQVFSKMAGVKIAGLCDPDQSKIAAAQEKFGPDAKTWQDLRALIDDKNIDAVVIAA